MEQNEKREKFGRIFYFTSLIVAIVVMLCALFIISDGSEESNINVSNIRYMIAFYSFLCIISPGVLVREYCKGGYDVKRFRLKIIVLIGTIIAGSLLFLLWIPAVTSVVFMASLVSFIFMMTQPNGK